MIHISYSSTFAPRRDYIGARERLSIRGTLDRYFSSHLGY